MENKQFFHTIVALFFMAVIAVPLVSQHCVALDEFSIEWSGLDNTEKESSKKLFDDISKDWIDQFPRALNVHYIEELSGINTGYFIGAQNESIALILDPPEDNIL